MKDSLSSIIVRTLIAEYPGVEQAEVGFMNSPGHRVNILDEYTHAGIGIVNKNGTYFITQWFAK